MTGVQTCALPILFTQNNFRGQVASVKSRFLQYSVGQGSVVFGRFGSSTLVAGDLRVITPRDTFKSPFTVLEKVTGFEPEDLSIVARTRPEILVERKVPNEDWLGRPNGHVMNQLLFGEYQVGQILVQETLHIHREREATPVSDNDGPSLGDILGAALKARCQ